MEALSGRTLVWCRGSGGVREDAHLSLEYGFRGRSCDVVGVDLDHNAEEGLDDIFKLSCTGMLAIFCVYNKRRTYPQRPAGRLVQRVP